MPKSVSLFRLFLASPADVRSEREIVFEVVDEFNRTYADRLNVKVEVCCWEKSTYPATGTYAQGVINSQIGEEYDIFLGILWTRFGSKTLNYESGTEEEYYRALQLSESTGRVHIMMYFNNEGVPLSTLDVNQYSKVQTFRQKIADAGCYYFMYDGAEQFRKEVSAHLYKVISNWDKEHPAEDPSLPVAVAAVAEGVEEAAEADEMDEYGILDLREKIDVASMAVLSALDEIREATEWIGQETQASAEKLMALSRNPQPNCMQQGKVQINALAAKMNQYSVRLEPSVSRWITSFEELISANRSLLQVAEDAVSSELLRERKEELRGLDERVEYAYSEIYRMYTSVKALPKMTQLIILAKKNVCAKLKKLLDSLERCQTLCSEFKDAINKRLYSFNP